MSQMTNQELQRRDWYLAALGVVRYVPRGRVVDQGVDEALPATEGSPGSPASEGRAALRQLLADEAPASQSLTHSAAASRTASADAEPPPVPASGLPSSVETDPAPPPGKPVPEQSADEIAVRLAVWQPTSDLLFFDSMQPGEQPSIQMARLVTNIVAALGRRADSAPMPQLIDWPPARSRVVGDLAAARTMVAAFCDARLSAGAVQLVVMLGSDAVRLLQPDEDPGEEVAIRATRWRDLDTVIVPPLSSLLGDPSAKRRVWQALAPFVRPDA